MRCPEIRAFLHPFLDGELDVEKNVVVLQHLELCGCCRDRFEGEKRLLVRVREAISERCPDKLRARMYEACASVACGSAEAAPTPLRPAVPIASPRNPRGFTLPWPRLLASSAAVALVFLGLDPLCLFGCPTVRALTREHRAHRSEALPLTGSEEELASKLSALTGAHVEAPRFCHNCCKLQCEGGQPVKVGDSCSLMRFRDPRSQGVVSFVQARGVHVHPMLRGQDGLYVAHEGDACFVGWREDGGDLCGFVADEPAMPVEGLVALAASVRAHERAGK